MRHSLSAPQRAALLAVVASLTASLAACQPGAAPAPVTASADSDTGRVQADVAYLASDRLEGRGAGTRGYDQAANYAAARFRALGLDSMARAGYLHRFTMRASRGAAGDGHAGGLASDQVRTSNVVAVVPGTDPARRGEYVVIGAHLDHLGRSAQFALDPDAGSAIRNGADDNASGSAAVLELARRFAERPAARTVALALFGGEEHGLVGSSRFVSDTVVPPARTSLMLNFDMIGRLRDDRVIVYGVETATGLRALVDSAAAGSGLTIRGMGDGYGPSDHASFYGAGVPVLHFFTDTHDDYHRATDDARKVNVPGIIRIVDVAERVARTAADRPARLVVQVTAPPQRTGSASASGTMPYFGSIPDMGAEVRGMRLTGVRAGSPADKGGLRAGDVVVRFGGAEVTDIYTYTAALQAHKPGDTVPVDVLRGAERLTLRVTLTARTQ